MFNPNIVSVPWAFFFYIFLTTAPLIICYLKIEASLVTLQYQVTVSESVFLVSPRGSLSSDLTYFNQPNLNVLYSSVILVPVLKTSECSVLSYGET